MTSTGALTPRSSRGPYLRKRSWAKLIALFVAVEILARTPWPAGFRWVALRYVGLLPVAFVAAVVSYRHLSGLLAWYGEEQLTATLGPLAVDGLMVMATGALLATAPALSTPTVMTPGNSVSPVMTATDAVPVPGSPRNPSASTTRTTKPHAVQGSTGRTARNPKAVKTSGAGAAAAIARTRVEHPEWTAAQIASRVGVTERTVRRHLAANSHPALTKSTEDADVNATSDDNPTEEEAA